MMWRQRAPKPEAPNPRVLVTDSSRIAREALCELLNSLGFVAASAGGYAPDPVPDWRDGDPPELLISRITSHGEAASAAAAIRKIRSRLPALKTVLLVDDALSHQVCLAMHSDVNAVLSHHISSDVLKRSLELVLLGQRILPPHAIPQRPGQAETSRTRRLAREPRADEPPVAIGLRPSLLSPREEEILRCLTTGMSNKSIARTLDITEATVKVHVKGVLRKTQLANRTQLAVWAIHNGSSPRPDIITGRAAHDRGANSSSNAEGP